MKISKIHIKDFHQFKDFTLDLTYPKGHEKEGKPLDKVCFIGQSGTGKTTLLELIPFFSYDYETNLIIKSNISSIKDNISIFIDYTHKELGFTELVVGPFNTEYLDSGVIKRLEQDNSISKSKLIYFPAHLNFNLDLEIGNKLNEKAIIDFSKDKVSIVWNIILEKIQSYQEQELKIRQDISKVVEKSSSNLTAIQEAVKKLEDWKKKNEFNPIQDVADNCLDALLANYKLRVKTEFYFNTIEDIRLINIEDYNGNHIPYSLWSTGTKQVILSALPLYLLKPKDTIILFDEPESSLYPDLQRIIVDYYSSLATDCQFFYSTHSPIIASNFEPWEIVELKFSEAGKIYREVYFEGENHIDNYKWNPKFMRWDDILQRVFDMENDGSPARKEKLDELATFNVKYKKLVKKGEENSPEAIEIIQKIEKLSKELSKWD